MDLIKLQTEDTHFSLCGVGSPLSIGWRSQTVPPRLWFPGEAGTAEPRELWGRLVYSEWGAACSGGEGPAQFLQPPSACPAPISYPVTQLPALSLFIRPSFLPTPSGQTGLNTQWGLLSPACSSDHMALKGTEGGASEAGARPGTKGSVGRRIPQRGQPEAGAHMACAQGGGGGSQWVVPWSHLDSRI